MADIMTPALGESVTEATVARWTKKAGDAVRKDEILVELETDKVSLEVAAPADGVLSEILAGEGDTVEPGTVLGKITTGGKFTQVAPAASNGSLNAAGILWGPADATAADAAAVVVLRGPAIVNRNDLIWPTGATEPQIAAATAALAALGILLR